MAEPLDSMLETGEEVVYWAPPRWKPNEWTTDWLIFGISIGLVAAVGLIGLDPASLAALAAAQAAPTLYVLGCYVRDWSREAVVTDRRLLHRTGWNTPLVTEVRTEDVRAVEAVRDQVRITRKDGTCLDLGHPHEGWELGVALAQSVGLAPLRVPTWNEWLADRLWLLSAFTVGLATAVILLKPLYPMLPPIAGSAGWIFAAGLFLGVGWFVHSVGMVSGGYLSLVLLRPVFSYAQMRDWLSHSLLFQPPAAEAHQPHQPCEMRLASLLYGRPMEKPRGGANPNG